MIDSKDLRIGNCYSTGLEVIGSREAKLNINESRGIKLTLNHFHIFSHAKELIQCLYPIKLTPSILEQIGFEKTIDIDNDDLFDFETSFICKLTLLKLRGVEYYRVMDVDNYIDIKYLHELQNTFYIFNNKQELPIDINTLKI